METALALYLSLRHAYVPQEPSNTPGIHIYANKHITAIQSVGDKYNVTFGLEDGIPFLKSSDGKTVIVKKASARLLPITVKPAMVWPKLEVRDSPSQTMRFDGVQPAWGGVQ